MTPKNHPELTAARLREALSYDPDTGIFRWAIARRRIVIGAIAGNLNDQGYRTICVDGKTYKAHRLAWLYVHGEWPAFQLDHRYGIRDDNRISELREATHAQNQQNRGLNRNNTSRHPGVSWDAERGKWKVSISVSGVEKKIGRFKDINEAIVARAKAKAEYHSFQPADRGALE